MSWIQILPSLSSSPDSCSIRLLDTVLNKCDELQKEWYFTTKNGVLSKKKPSKTTNEDICSRFIKFSLANPNNTDLIVGVLHSKDSEKKYFKEEDLKTFIETWDNTSDEYLQVYLRPQKGMYHEICHNYLNDQGTLDWAVSVETEDSTTDLSIFPNNEFISNQLAIFTSSIVKSLSATITSHSITGLEARYVIDDNNHIWLSSISNIKTSELFSDHEDNLPPPNVSLPELPPRTTSSQKRQSSHQKILFKEGNIWRCSLGPEHLSGLKAWTLQSTDTTGKRHQWTVDMSKYTEREKMSVHDEQMVKSRSKIIRNVPYDMYVLLSKAIEMGLATGEMQLSGGEEDFKAEWRRLYQSVRVSSTGSRSNSDVQVDGNFDAVCAKLSSLISCDFQTTSKQNFESDDIQDITASTTRNDSERILRDDQSTANIQAARGGKPSTAEGKARTRIQQLKNELEAQEFSSVSVLTERNSDITPSVVEKSLVTKASPANLYNVKKSTNANGVKGKKTKTGSPHVGKKPAFVPPDMNLIAKFAAEKEIQKKILLQSETNDLSEHHQRERGRGGWADEHDHDDDGSYQSNSNNNGIIQNKTRNIEDTRNGDTRKKKGADGNKLRALSQVNDEQRLFELERLASSSVYGFPSEDGRGGIRPPHSNQPSVSFSEENFMLRQASIGDSYQSLDVTNLNGNSLIEGNNNVSSMNRQKSNTHLEEKIIDSLNARIALLEKQVKAQTDTINRKDIDLSKMDQKYKRLSMEYVEFKSSSKNELEAASSKYENEILQLKEKNSSRQAAEVQHDLKNAVNSPSSPIRHLHDISNAGGAPAMTSLLEQLDVLRLEMRKNNEKYNLEKKTLQNECSARLLNLENKYNRELQSQKDNKIVLEDLVEKLKDEVKRSHAKIEDYSIQVKALEDARIEAINGQNKAKGELKALQQSAAAAYRLESTQAIGIGVDADTAIKLNDSKHDAKNRQLANQVEFLKSQLSAELASLEDMRRVCDAAKEKAEIMRLEYRERLAEAERIRVRDVEAAELRTEQRYDARMSEFTALQSKFLMIQNQIQDSLHDSEISKQKEELAKSQASKAQAQIVLLRQETETLRGQLSELRDRSDMGGTENEVSKNSQDSMLRRLDNERQYLKSQLSSEITLKNELQQTLLHCQNQLADIQRQWTEDVETLNEQKKQTEQETLHIEQGLTRKLAAADNDVNRLNAENEEVKTAFMKVRDQLRSEQQLLENHRSMINNLSSMLREAKEEIESLKENENSNQILFQNQLRAVKMSLGEMEDSKARELQSMKEELAKQFLSQCDAQKQSMALRHDFEDAKKALEKQNAGRRFISSMKLWHHARMSFFLRKWSRNVSLVIAAGQFREKLNRVVKKMTDDHQFERERAIEKVKSIAARDLENKLSGQKMELDWKLQEELSNAEFKFEEERKQFQKDRESAISERNNFYQSAIEALEAKHVKEREKETELKQQQITEYKSRTKHEMQSQINHIEQQAYADKLAVADSVAKEWALKLDTLQDEMAKEMEQKLKALKDDHKLDLAAMTREYEQMKVNEIAAMTITFNNKELDMIEDHKYDVETLKKQHADQLVQVDDTWRLQLAQKLEESRFIWEKTDEERLRSLRDLWNEELEQKLKEKDSAIASIIEKETSIIHKTNADNLVKAVKLETSKWQQTMKEADKRFALEILQAKTRGYNECEKKKNAEMWELSENRAREIFLAEEKQKLFISEMNARREEEIAQIREQHHKDSVIALNNAQAELLEKVQKEFAVLVDEKTKQAALSERAIWEPKLHKESNQIERMKVELNRQLLHQAEERRQLSETIEGMEQRIKDLTALTEDSARNLKEQIELERDKHEAILVKVKKAVILDEGIKHEIEMSDAMKVWESETEIKLERESKKYQEKLDDQLNEMQNENDKLIGGLERALEELKKEKIALSNQLESTMLKLEHAEDSIYDQVENIKGLNKKNSFIVWRNAVRSIRINAIFADEKKKQAEDFENKLIQLEKHGKEKLSEVVLIGIRLSNLIVNTEKYRENIFSALSNYKTSLLIEKRTHIKMLEQALSRMTEQRDMFEESKEKMEDEVCEYEGQIRELEEQMREHNRNSSVMQNGRINASHARKKKRIDTELERLLDLVEQKRSQITEMIDQITVISQQKDKKESELIDMEKDLVQILIEQQRLVLGISDEMKSINEKGKVIIKMSRLPWPPPENPSSFDVQSCIN